MDAVDLGLENADLDNQRNYQKLMVALESSEGTLNLLLCVCDDRTYREQLIHNYEAELQQQNVRPYRIRLAWQQPSLRRSLLELVQSTPDLQGTPAVITVLGMDELLSVKLGAETSEQEQLFFSLQWTREALREFRYPLVLWLTNAVLVRLADRAPDFWSWRGGVFWFTSPRQARIDAQIEQARSLADQKGLFDPQTAAAWNAVEQLQVESSVVPEIEVVITDAVEKPYVDWLSLDPTPSQPALALPDDPTGLPLEDLQQLIAQIEQQQGSDAPLLATLYDSLGLAYNRRLNQGEATDYPQERQLAIDAFEKAIALQTKLRLEQDLLNSLVSVADLYNFRHQVDIACDYYEQAFHLAQKLGNRWAEGAILTNLGGLYRNLGRYQQAIELHQKSLTIDQELGDYQGEASSLSNLGIAYATLGQYDRAIEFHQQSLELVQKLGDRRGEANALGGLGNAYYSLGHYDRAIEFHQQHLEIARELGDRQGEANALGNLGVAYYSLGHYDQAIEFHQQSLKIKRDIDDRRGEASTLDNLGAVYHSLGHYDKAIEFYQQSLEIARELGNQRGEANASFNLGLILVTLKQTATAIQSFRHARELYQTMGLGALVQKCNTEIQRLEGEGEAVN